MSGASRRLGVHVVALLLAASPGIVSAQSPGDESTRPQLAIVGVDVVALERDSIIPAQTVLVRGDRIVEVGEAAELAVADGATVISGSGRYLVPGLVDAHVHLVGDGTGVGVERPNFGDGPLYLAYGVTTVFNLRGTPAQLEWRRRIENGELIGPTIYTAGEFINEPLVDTPDEVEREVAAQVGAGYDILKFHELLASPRGPTTTGLTRESYRRLIDSARDNSMPLLGHAPVNLGLDVLLQAGQPLAHVGALSNVYFLPLASNPSWLLLTVGAVLVLATVVAALGVARLSGSWRRGAAAPPETLPSIGRSAAVVAGASILAGLSATLFLPGGPMWNSRILRLAFTALVLLALAATARCVIATVAVWRYQRASATSRLSGTLACLASLGLVLAGVAFWMPLAWRSSQSGIERLAARVHDAGIPLQTTLVVYDAIGGPGRARLVEDPVMRYLQPDVRARWLQGPQAGPPGYRYTEFMKAVVGALHREGVTLMAGTDSMGAPRLAPGAALHHELRLLVESGLSRTDALRAATTVPAAFLNRGGEFGTISPGARADLLLVEGNPLEDLDYLRRPSGVVARGRWLTREQLDGLLEVLD